jgi:hypothetical protein
MSSPAEKIRERRTELVKQLYKAVSEFEKETGTTVTDIELQHRHTIDAGRRSDLANVLVSVAVF